MLKLVAKSCMAVSQAVRLDECEALNMARLWPVGVPVLALGSCPRLASLELAAPALTRLDLRYTSAHYHRPLVLGKSHR